MATIFSEQTAAFDGSSSPATGSADVDICYDCTPTDGGKLELYTRPASTTIDYVLLWDAHFPTMKKFNADGVQYYFVWTPKVSNAVADLEG